MSDSVLSKLSVELEAQQAKLDRGLDAAEQKTKRVGEKMEKNLSVEGSADKLAALFTAVGKVEAGLRGAVGVIELFKGNADAALEAFERMPFGIGPAVQAGHELFDALSGAREESAKMVEDFGKLPDLIRSSQGEIAALRDLLADPGTRNQQQLAGANERNARINEQLAGLTDIINKLSRFEAARGTGDFNFTRTGPRFGATAIADAPEALRTALEEAGIAAKTVGEALAELRRQRAELFELGQRARDRSIADLADRATEQRNRQADRRIAGQNPFEAERQRIEAEFGKRIAEALTESLARELEDELAARLRDIAERERQDSRRRAAPGFDLELRETQRRQREQAIQREQRAPVFRAQGFSIEEFRRLLPGGGVGQRQEVEDTKAHGLLGTIRDAVQRISNSTSTAVLG